MGLDCSGRLVGARAAVAAVGAGASAGWRVANIDDEAVFAAVVYVLVSGCAWRALPPCFGAPKSTVHRRFLIWSRAGVWGRLHQEVVQLLSSTRPTSGLNGGANTQVRVPWTEVRRFQDACLVGRERLPLRVGLSAANTHDSHGLKPMVAHFHVGHEDHSAGSKPQRLHADKAYDLPDLRRWLHGKRIGVRIARKGIESSERLGRRRWVIERTMSWLSRYRRLSPRYERHPRNYLAFLGLAAALCCYKHLLKLTHPGHGLRPRPADPGDPALPRRRKARP
jgi:transposase